MCQPTGGYSNERARDNAPCRSDSRGERISLEQWRAEPIQRGVRDQPRGDGNQHANDRGSSNEESDTRDYRFPRLLFGLDYFHLFRCRLARRLRTLRRSGARTSQMFPDTLQGIDNLPMTRMTTSHAE